MKQIFSKLLPLTIIGFLGLSPATTAQETVPSLRDLIGARASSGEQQLQSRGYVYVRGSKSGGGSYTYWKEPRTGRCVSVRTADGDYSAIVYTPAADCGESSVAPSPEKDESFDTVCGVESGGQSHRYVCKLRNEGCKGEGYCRTILTFPDNELRITWKKNKQMEVAVTGLQPEKTSFTSREGQTRFQFGGNTYSVYRNPDRAKREVANFRK